jgi:hypothetical protein
MTKILVLVVYDTEATLIPSSLQHLDNPGRNANHESIIQRTLPNRIRRLGSVRLPQLGGRYVGLKMGLFLCHSHSHIQDAKGSVAGDDCPGGAIEARLSASAKRSADQIVPHQSSQRGGRRFHNPARQTRGSQLPP